MALTVPEQQISNIKWLLGLPDEKLQGFLLVLSQAGPQFNVYDLADEISNKLQVPEHRIVGALRVLASLYLTREFAQPIENFVDHEVHFALKRAGAVPSDTGGEQWERLRKFLVSALGFERTLGTAAKAGNVLTQHERIFKGVRIMTDLRPIFHVNVSEMPDAAVVIHMLKLTHRDNSGNQKDIYFALDHNDVVTMQGALERALKKEQTLRDAMKNSNIAVLDPKLYF